MRTFTLNRNGAIAEQGARFSSTYNSRFGGRPSGPRSSGQGRDIFDGALGATDNLGALPLLIINQIAATLRQIRMRPADPRPYEIKIQAQANISTLDMAKIRSIAYVGLGPYIPPLPPPPPPPPVDIEPAAVETVTEKFAPALIPITVSIFEIRRRLQAYDGPFLAFPPNIKSYLALTYRSWVSDTIENIKSALQDPSYTNAEKAALNADGAALFMALRSAENAEQLWQGTPPRIRRYWLNMHRYKILSYIVESMSPGAEIPEGEIVAPWPKDLLQLSALKPTEPQSPYTRVVAADITPGITPTEPVELLPAPTRIIPATPSDISPKQIVRGRELVKIVGDPSLTIMKAPSFKIGIPVIIGDKELTLWAYHPPVTAPLRDRDDGGEEMRRQLPPLIGRDLESFIFEPETLSGADREGYDELGFFSALWSAAKSAYGSVKKLIGGKAGTAAKGAISMISPSGKPHVNVASAAMGAAVQNMIKMIKGMVAKDPKISRAQVEAILKKRQMLSATDREAILSNVFGGQGIVVVTPRGAAKTTANLYRAVAHTKEQQEPVTEKLIRTDERKKVVSAIKSNLSEKLKRPFDPEYLLNGLGAGYLPAAEPVFNLLPKPETSPTRATVIRSLRSETQEKDLMQKVNSEKARIKSYRQKNIFEIGKIKTLINMLRRVRKGINLDKYVNYFNVAGVRAKILDEKLANIGTLSGHDSKLGAVPFVLLGLAGLASLLGWQAFDYKKEAEKNEIIRKELEMIAGGQISPGEIVDIKSAPTTGFVLGNWPVPALLGLLGGGLLIWQLLKK